MRVKNETDRTSSTISNIIEHAISVLYERIPCLVVSNFPIGCRRSCTAVTQWIAITMS